MEEKSYIITDNIKNSLILYLSQKPYREVWQGIQALESLQVLDKVTKDKEDSSN